MRLPSVDLIDYQDSRPIYEQISEKYKILILKGVLEPDEKIEEVQGNIARLKQEIAEAEAQLDVYLKEMGL